MSSLLITGTAPPPPPDQISGGAAWGIDNSGQKLNVDAQQTQPGTPGSESAGPEQGANLAPNIEPIVYVPELPTQEECLANRNNMIYCWRLLGPEEDAEEQEDDSTPAIPEITVTDLASFSPAPGTLIGEPDNLGVAGLPSNFVTDASVHTQSGELFGFPIQVRFTPTTFTFHYGDGESRASDTAGASWDDLDQAQFTPTDTSHSYAERGTYQASVDITYTAEIDLGVGWFPIAGELNIDGAAQPIRIYEAHTALVAHTCDENPGAPGC